MEKINIQAIQIFLFEMYANKGGIYHNKSMQDWFWMSVNINFV